MSTTRAAAHHRPITDDARQMLALSLVTYRGAIDTHPSVIGRIAVTHAIEDGLSHWPALAPWELAWGPGVHQTPLTVFDDDVVFVARHTEAPRYAVAIRGTNPVDLLDWVFGDFLVRDLIPWPLADTTTAPRPATSASAYRGLAYLRAMKSGDGALDAAWRAGAALVFDPARRIAGTPLRRMDPFVDRTLRRLEMDVAADMRRAHTVRRRLRTLTPPQRWELLDALWHALANLSDPALGVREARRRILRRLIDLAVLPQRFQPGTTLIEFLAREIAATDGPVEVFVTGHSKGGALAPVLALWLAQTQGESPLDDATAWDPWARATVHCHAFAGPTPGNAAFAELYDAVLGARGHRYANRADVVPHAWSVPPRADDPGLHLRNVGRLYGGAIADHPILRGLLATIEHSVAEGGYTHTGRDVHLLPGRAKTDLDLVPQLVYQHLNAYGRLLHLDTDIDPLSIVA